MEKKPMYYSNLAQIKGTSSVDFKIAFGVKKDVNKPINEDDIDFYIHTSPLHLKSLGLLI